MDRRNFVKITGVAAAVGLAGCLHGDDEEPDNGDDDDDANGDENGDDFIDETGQDEVTVANGAGDGFQFDPSHIEIDVGTTVVWEWTGEGGAHNVLHEPGEREDDTGLDEPAFNSGSAVAGDDETYEYTFEETGTYAYVCDPHRAQEMFGAVRVVGEAMNGEEEENGEENGNGDDENGEE